MASPLGRVGSTLYKTLLKNAKKFNERPALKALICRSVGEEALPQPLDNVVAAFLGGPGRSYFWPEPDAVQSVEEAVRIAFRFPLDEPDLEGAFQGLRYLSGLLSVAQKHGMLEAKRAAATQLPTSHGGPHPGIQLLAVPERGAVLIAHPALPPWFARSALLLCQHSDIAGSYALCINKPLDGSVRDLTEKINAATGSGRSLSDAAGSRSFATTAAAALVVEPEDVRFDKSPGGAAAHQEDGDEANEEDVAAGAHARVLGSLVEGLEFGDGIGSIAQLEVVDGNDLLMQLAAAVEAVHAGEESDSGGEEDGDEDEDSSDTPLQIRLEGVEAVPAIQALLEAVAARQASVAVDAGWGAGDDDDDVPPLTLSQGHLLLGAPAAQAAAAGYASGGPSSSTLAGGRVGDWNFGSASASADTSATQLSSESSASPSLGAAAVVGEVVTAKQLMALFAGSPLFRGGPVPGVQILHCRGRLGGQQVLPPTGGAEGVYLGCDARALAQAPALFKQQYLAEDDVKVFVGDSAWAPAQLQMELEMGSWALVRIAPEVLDLFGPLWDVPRGTPPADFEHATWQRLLRTLGGGYAELGAVPPGVWEDLAQLRV